MHEGEAEDKMTQKVFTPKMTAGTGVRADFKPPISQRKVEYLSREEAQKGKAQIHAQFGETFRILSK